MKQNTIQDEINAYGEYKALEFQMRHEYYKRNRDFLRTIKRIRAYDYLCKNKSDFDSIFNSLMMELSKDELNKEVVKYLLDKINEKIKK